MQFKRADKLVLSLVVLSLSAVYAGYPVSEDAIVKAVARVEPTVVNIRTTWHSGYGEFTDEKRHFAVFV